MDKLEEAAVPTIAGMDSDGWSNSPEVKGAPQDVTPEVGNVEMVPEAGWSNTAAHKPTVDAERARAKALGITLDDEESQPEAKTVEAPKKATARKQTRASAKRKS